MTFVDFSGQKVVLTGAAGGIGKSILKKLLSLGASVYITGRSKEKTDLLIAEHMNIEPGKIVGYYVGDICAQETLIKDAAAALGGIDIFIHAAGITRDGLFMKQTNEDWDEVMNTNLKIAFRLSQDCMPFMMKQRYGRIVFLTSIVGASGNMGQANYIASKAGLTGLSKGIASDCARWNITANCVEPGFIDTDMTSALPEEIKQTLLKRIPMNRMGAADEVANCVLFLCSKEASYITGTALRVNGGMLMM